MKIEWSYRCRWRLGGLSGPWVPIGGYLGGTWSIFLDGKSDLKLGWTSNAYGSFLDYLLCFIQNIAPSEKAAFCVGLEWSIYDDEQGNSHRYYTAYFMNRQSSISGWKQFGKSFRFQKDEVKVFKREGTDIGIGYLLENMGYMLSSYHFINLKLKKNDEVAIYFEITP